MAHFAQVENNLVTKVIVVNNETLEHKDFPESETIGIAFCKSVFGEDTDWLQTSYNGTFRGCYAGVGMTYDPVKDEFITPTGE